MTGRMTNQQRFDFYDQQLGELAGVPDRLINITSMLDRVDLERLVTRVENLEGLRDRVAALENVKAPRGGA